MRPSHRRDESRSRRCRRSGSSAHRARSHRIRCADRWAPGSAWSARCRRLVCAPADQPANHDTCPHSAAACRWPAACAGTLRAPPPSRSRHKSNPWPPARRNTSRRAGALGLAIGPALVLTVRAGVPLDAEPAQVVHLTRDVLILAPLGVRILHAQDQPAAQMPGQQLVEQRSTCIAQMQLTRRAGRKSPVVGMAWFMRPAMVSGMRALPCDLK